jgi:predicted dehydrogenase
MIQPHSVLVIGCGSIGERHLRGFLNTRRTLVAACDISLPLRERLHCTYGVPTRDHWEAALASGDFTAVAICTPAHLHVDMARRAIAAGLHVLIEKPLSQSIDGVAELLDEHRRSGREAALAYNYHVYPFLCEAREHLLASHLGSIQQVAVVSGQPFYQFRPAYAQTYYRSHHTGGGAVQDALTHLANWVESVVGPTDSVFCECAHLALPGVEVEDTAHICARHGGVLVSYALNQFQAPNETSLHFNTLDGSLKIEFHRQRWGTFRNGDLDWNWRDYPIAERDTHALAQANAFLDQIEGLPARLCSLEAGAQTLRFNLAALASASTGIRVRCSDKITSPHLVPW